MNMTVDMQSLKTSAAIVDFNILPQQDAKLASAYAKFLTARQAVEEAHKLPMSDLSNASVDQKKNHANWTRLVDKACDLARNISAIPANTMDGMLLKIRVFGYYAGNHNKSLDELDRWEGGALIQPEDAAVITTLRSDLERIKSGRVTTTAKSVNDPVFERIDEHRVASKAYNAAKDNEDKDEHRAWTRAETALRHGAKTAAGWAALIRYAEQHDNMSVEGGEVALWSAILPKLAKFLDGKPISQQSEGASNSPPCPVLALAIEASDIIAAWNAIDDRKGDGKEHPRDDRRHEILTDRLDAVQEAASFLVPTSDDGAAFQLALAAGIHDLLITSTFAAECVKVSHEKRCTRLIAAATAYMMTRRVTKANKWWPQVSGYFGGYFDVSPHAVWEAIQSAGVKN